MAITLNDNIYVDAPKPTDPRFGPGSAWSSLAAAKAGVPSGVRFIGLVVGVMVDDKPVDYYFRDGIDDDDLVVKQTENTATNTTYDSTDSSLPSETVKSVKDAIDYLDANKAKDNQVVKLNGNQDIADNKNFKGQTRAVRKTIDVSASRALTLADVGCRLRIDASLSDITITIPAQASVAFLVDAEIELYKRGSFKVIITRAVSVVQESSLSPDADLYISESCTSCLLKREAENIWSNQGGTLFIYTA